MTKPKTYALGKDRLPGFKIVQLAAGSYHFLHPELKLLSMGFKTRLTLLSYAPDIATRERARQVMADRYMVNRVELEPALEP